MSDLDAPATKQDIHDLRYELDKLTVKIGLAFRMLATGLIAIIVAAVMLILRG